MKKTGEAFQPIEVVGLLHLCANRSDWRDIDLGGVGSLFYRATNPKGVATGQTYLATLDDTARRLFVYSPEWRPDFNRELWITPDEAPVHREAERAPAIGKGSSGSGFGVKQPSSPGASLFGKPASASSSKRAAYDSKGVASDPAPVSGNPKQGIYLPKLNKVVPADTRKNPKAVKRDQRKRQKQGAEFTPSGK
jgi:hypothetical protein